MKNQTHMGLLPELDNPRPEHPDEYRERLIIEAIKEHKILAAEHEWYRTQYVRDPVGTQHLLASLEPGVAIMAKSIGADDDGGTGLLPEIRE